MGILTLGTDTDLSQFQGKKLYGLFNLKEQRFVIEVLPDDLPWDVNLIEQLRKKDGLDYSWIGFTLSEEDIPVGELHLNQVNVSCQMEAKKFLGKIIDAVSSWKVVNYKKSTPPDAPKAVLEDTVNKELKETNDPNLKKAGVKVQVKPISNWFLLRALGATSGFIALLAALLSPPEMEEKLDISRPATVLVGSILVGLSLFAPKIQKEIEIAVENYNAFER